MDGTDQVSLATSNHNTSEPGLVTLGQDGKQLGNVDGGHNNFVVADAGSNEPQFIEITAKVEPTIDLQNLDLQFANREPPNENHSSEPSFNEDDEIDRLEREVKETHRRMSLEQQQPNEPQDQDIISPSFSPVSQLVSPHMESNQSHDEPEAEIMSDGVDNNKNEHEDKGQEEALGRNRRVRQKNRYFLDFHCSNLTKGSRGKDEFDAYAAATGGGGSATRSSNRRTTTDSARGAVQGSQEEDDSAPIFVTKYCRSCFSKTPHDIETGCQACLYRKIVSEQKRQRTSSQRSRPSRQQQQKQQQPQEDGDTIPNQTSNAGSPVQVSTPSSSSTRGKRKASKQAGGPTKQQISDMDASKMTILNSPSDCPIATEAKDKTPNRHPVATIQQKSTSDSKVDTNNDSSNNNATAATLPAGDLGAKNPGIPKLTATMKIDGTGQKRKWVVKPSRSPNDENVISIRRETEHEPKMDSLDEKSSTLAVSNENNAENNNNTSISNGIHIDDASTKKAAKVCDTKASNNLTSNNNNNSHHHGEGNNNDLELTHLDRWTPEQVARYVSSRGFVSEADSFKSQAVDGVSLLLMQRTDFTHGLKMKLGPALKLYNQVCKLRDDYFRQIAPVP